MAWELANAFSGLAKRMRGVLVSRTHWHSMTAVQTFRTAGALMTD